MCSPRVALVVSLYEAKSNRCGTCGRRFPTTQEGKEKKARHLDWHFKTNQRMSEAAKRAQTRSWYVDERVCPNTTVSILVCILYTNCYCRIGSNPANPTTTSPWLMSMPPLKAEPAQTAMPQNKARPRHGSGPPTMQRFATHLVPFARKSLSQPGQRTYRTGSGRMLSRSVVVSIMRAAMLKSPRMALHHGAQRLKRVLARPTRCWASARQRELILPVARRVSRQRHEICKLEKPTMHNSIRSCSIMTLLWCPARCISGRVTVGVSSSTSNHTWSLGWLRHPVSFLDFVLSLIVNTNLLLLLSIHHSLLLDISISSWRTQSGGVSWVRSRPCSLRNQMLITSFQ